MAHFDLVIIGTGSGNSIVDAGFDGLEVAIVERGTFGGTCLNVGCIPTKMFVYPADVARAVARARRLGIDAHAGQGALAGHPGPRLRPDRPDLARRRGLPGTAASNITAVRGPRPVHRTAAAATSRTGDERSPPTGS